MTPSLVAQSVLRRSRELVTQWLWGGELTDPNQWQCANLAGDPGDGVRVNLEFGLWFQRMPDDAWRQGGDDLISLYAAIQEIEYDEAESRLALQLANGHAKAVEKQPEVLPSLLNGKGKKDPGKPHSAIPTPVAFTDPKDRSVWITEETHTVTWADLGLEANARDVPYPTLANASLVLLAHPDLTGKIWYDSFREKVFHTLDSTTPREWEDINDLKVTAWMQQRMKLHKITVQVVRDAVMHAARHQPRHSLHDYIEGLQWDGRSRLKTWMSDCLGAELNPYTQAVSQNWPIAMIARAYRPGIQMDNVLVLEGKMGHGKSKFVEILGAPWFASLTQSFGTKDFLMEIIGRWLVELPDMNAFLKQDHTQNLSVVTRRTDSYRAPYARHVKDHPRVALFVGTSENDDYLQDTRGRRRWWPIRCSAIDLDATYALKDQIFAEAFLEYKRGTDWYITPETDTLSEQTERVARDPWADRVESYCSILGHSVRIGDILSASECLNIPPERQSRREVLRVAAVLREMGWKKARPKDSTGRSFAAWDPPNRP